MSFSSAGSGRFQHVGGPTERHEKLCEGDARRLGGQEPLVYPSPTPLAMQPTSAPSCANGVMAHQRDPRRGARDTIWLAARFRVVDFAIIMRLPTRLPVASVGRPLESEPAMIAVLSDVVRATCTDAAREHGLIKLTTEVPADATDTERLMSTAGRAIRR